MKKTILAMTGAAFLGTATLIPTPASAFVFVALPFVMEAKKDKNFKAVNPYAPKKVVKKRAAKKKR
jgi:hypothetical protein